MPLGEQHSLEVRADDSARFVEADQNLLRAAFDNVILNAAQATPKGGTIDVEVEDVQANRAPGVLVTLRDSGAGMDAATAARALDPFFTTRPSGTGLGLPIVQRVVQAHGGHVELESENGCGTTVRIWLPRTAP